MPTIKAAITRRAVLSYVALVCVISGGGMLLIIGPQGFPLNAAQFASFGPFAYQLWFIALALKLLREPSDTGEAG